MTNPLTFETPDGWEDINIVLVSSTPPRRGFPSGPLLQAIHRSLVMARGTGKAIHWFDVGLNAMHIAFADGNVVLWAEPSSATEFSRVRAPHKLAKLMRKLGLPHHRRMRRSRPDQIHDVLAEELFMAARQVNFMLTIPDRPDGPCTVGLDDGSTYSIPGAFHLEIPMPSPSPAAVGGVA